MNKLEELRNKVQDLQPRARLYMTTSAGDKCAGQSCVVRILGGEAISDVCSEPFAAWQSALDRLERQPVTDLEEVRSKVQDLEPHAQLYVVASGGELYVVASGGDRCAGEPISDVLGSPMAAWRSALDRLERHKTLQTFEGGATRTPKTERRELIPREAIDALARRLALGAEKHGEGNWKKGGTEFRAATVNHILTHIFEYLEHGGRENTDAIICNAAFLCYYEERIPHASKEKN